MLIKQSIIKYVTAIGLSLALFTVAVMPALAEEYLYVNTEGNLAVETAATPTEAILTAENIMHNSGVIEADEFAAPVSNSEGNVYAYVDVTGSLRFETADNPDAAIVNAENRAANSGVLLVSS